MLAGALWRKDSSNLTQNGLTVQWTASDHAYFELKGYAETLVKQLNTEVQFKVSDGGQPIWMHPARCALVQTAQGLDLGYMGSLHPDVIENTSLGEFCACFEWNLEVLEQLALTYGNYEEIPRFPAISYDLSVIVPETVSYQQIRALVLQAHKTWVKSVECVSIYRGDPIPDGQKSVTIQMQLQDATTTLEMDKVNKMVERLVKRFSDELGGWIR